MQYTNYFCKLRRILKVHKFLLKKASSEYRKTGKRHLNLQREEGLGGCI